MKPFNLELAKQGHPVVTRDGREVKQLTHFENCSDEYTVYCTVGDSIYSATEDGCHFEVDDCNDLDLFMASTKHEGWINIYKSKELMYRYDSKKEAIRASNNFDGKAINEYITTIKIEWEE